MTGVRVVSRAELGDERVARFEGRDHGAAVSFFLTRFAPGTGPSLHVHPYEETFVLESGRATFTVDGEAIDAHADQIVVVPAAAAHAFVNSGDDDLVMVSIHPSDHFVQEWLPG
jgi:quercetin dioxygenase-like cupin family protein